MGQAKVLTPPRLLTATSRLAERGIRHKDEWLAAAVINAPGSYHGWCISRGFSSFPQQFHVFGDVRLDIHGYGR